VSKVLGLDAWKRFSKGIGNHIFGRAKDEPNGAVLDDPTDEMISDIDVFGTRVILVVFGKSNGRFVVGK
jgi:hypothetical protein